MSRKLTRRQFGALFWPAMLGLAASGCGTILYPERRGQPAGRLDWGVVALDGIGLILFFIPGVIAFAVDFATGAIYLPYDGYGSNAPAPSSRLRRIDVPRSQLTPCGISHAVAAATGCTITLESDNYQSRPLESLDAFWDARNELVAAAGTSASRCVLRSQSPAFGDD